MSNVKVSKIFAAMLSLMLVLAMSINTFLVAFAADSTVKVSSLSRDVAQIAGQANTYTAGSATTAPDIIVEVTFPSNSTPTIIAGDFETDDAQTQTRKNIQSYVEVVNSEVNPLVINDVTYSGNKLTFVAVVSQSGTLKAGSYDLAIASQVSAYKDADGNDQDGTKVDVKFEIEDPTTTTTTTTSTTRSTTRTTITNRSTTRTVTVTTKSGTKATPANTGDNSHLALWIGIAVVAAGMFVFFIFENKKAKEDEE